MNNAIGNWLIILGLALVILGIIAKTGVLAWFGHLPLDLHIKREGFQFFVPLGSMIVISIVVSICISILRKIL